MKKVESASKTPIVDAMKEQLKKEPKYFTRRSNWGLGYEVGDHEKFVLHYYTSDEKQAKKACEMLNAGKTAEQLPAPMENWIPKLIIFKEKHGDRYFLVKTINDLREIALKIFNERKKEGWYDFSDLKDKPEEPLTEDQIKALPNESLKKAAKDRNASLVREIRDYKDRESVKKMYDVIVKNKDSKLALRFLDKMREGQYERFEVESFENQRD